MARGEPWPPIMPHGPRCWSQTNMRKRFTVECAAEPASPRPSPCGSTHSAGLVLELEAHRAPLP